MKCPKCGFENNNSSEFCSNCGSKLYINNTNAKKRRWLIVITSVFIFLLVVGSFFYFYKSNSQVSNVKKVEKISSPKKRTSAVDYNKLGNSDRKKVNFEILAVNNNQGVASPVYDLQVKIVNNTRKTVNLNLDKFEITGQITNSPRKSSSDGSIKIKSGQSYKVKKLFTNLGGQSLLGDIDLDYMNTDFKISDLKDLEYDDSVVNSSESNSSSNDSNDNDLYQNSESSSVNSSEEAVSLAEQTYGNNNGDWTWGSMGTITDSDTGEDCYFVKAYSKSSNTMTKTAMSVLVYKNGQIKEN